MVLLGCSKPAVEEKTTSAGSAGSAASDDVKPHHRKHEDRRAPVIDDAPPLRLEVVVAGAPAVWQQAEFAKVAKYTKGVDGEARDVWSLRDLARELAGPTARVVAVTGQDGTRTIDATAWTDDKRTPLLHTTRRGTLKFRWANAAGKWGEAEVRDVSKLELAAK